MHDNANLSGIVEHMLQCDDDSVDILPFLEEPKWLTERQFSDDIKGIFLSYVSPCSHISWKERDCLQYCSQAAISQTFASATSSSSFPNNV